jgi:hypothetical protein
VVRLYLRIFQSHKWFKYSLWLISGLIVIFFLLTFFLVIFQCNPPAAAFDFTITNAKCISIKDFFYASGSVNVITDLLLVALPMPLVWQLNLNVRKRLLIIFLFSLGILASVASMIRLTTLHLLGAIDVTCEHFMITLQSAGVNELITNVYRYHRFRPSVVNHRNRYRHNMRFRSCHQATDHSLLPFLLQTPYHPLRVWKLTTDKRRI